MGASRKSSHDKPWVELSERLKRPICLVSRIPLMVARGLACLSHWLNIPKNLLFKSALGEYGMTKVCVHGQRVKLMVALSVKKSANALQSVL